MNKPSLIELLKDSDIKEILVDILNPYFLERKDTDNLEVENNSLLDNSIESELKKQLEEENRNLKNKINTMEEELKEMGKFIKNLMKLLGVLEKKEMEPAIINKDQELKKLEEQKRKLKLEIDSLKDNLEKEKNRLSIEIENAQNQLNRKKDEINKISSENKNLSEKIDYYRKKFDKDIIIYTQYRELSDNTRDSLKGIFKDDSLQGFIACGIQEKNISSLWDYIKDEIREDKNPDISKLKDIFEFLFERYTLAYPIFKLQQVNTGDTFDDFSHIRHSNSKNVNGEISEVVFRGWINTKLEKVIKKSIVKMG